MQIGFFYAFFYILSIVISTLWIQSLSKEYSIYLLLLSSAFWAIIIFNGINFKTFVTTHKIILLDLNNWILMSVILSLGWLFTYLGAAVNALVLLTVAFLAHALFAMFAHRMFLKAAINFLIIFVIFCIERSEMGSGLASVYGALTGFFTFLFFNQAAAFAEKHDLDARHVLSIRFYLLFVLALGLFVFESPAISFSFSGSAVFILLCFAILNQILPNLFSQLTAQHLSTEKFNFMISLVPLLAFMGNGLMYGEWMLSMGIVTLLATLSLNYDNLAKVFKPPYTPL